MPNIKYKTRLISHLKEGLLDKIARLNEQIKHAELSQQNDTKSSAGDKFETGREMLQAEINKYENQRHSLQEALKALEQIKTTASPQTVNFGSLVICNNATYFIALGLGKIKFEGQDIFAISLASPIGKQLQKQEKHASLTINGHCAKIEEII